MRQAQALETRKSHCVCDRPRRDKDCGGGGVLLEQVNLILRDF